MPPKGLLPKQASVPQPSGGLAPLSPISCSHRDKLRGASDARGWTTCVHSPSDSRKVRASQDTLPHGEAEAAPLKEPCSLTPRLQKGRHCSHYRTLSFEDGQPVQLEDGSMAFIHRTPKGGVTVLMTGEKEAELAVVGGCQHCAPWGRDGAVGPTHSPGLAGTPAFPQVDRTRAAASAPRSLSMESMAWAGGSGSSTATKC